jgi:putative DNA primase/helicase
VNSIIKAHQSFCQRVDILFIDEAFQVVRHIVSDSVKSAERALVFDQLVAMIRHARVVVVADADVNDLVVRFIEFCRPNERFTVREARDSHPDIRVTWQHGRQAPALAFDNVLFRLAAGQKVIVATDSIAKSEILFSLIATELPDKRILLINRRTSGGAAQQRFLENPNVAVLRYDCLVYSPTISSGISITADHFDIGFGIFFGVIMPSDAHQMLRRARAIKRFHLAFDQNNSRGMDSAADIESGWRQAGGERLTDFDGLVARVRAMEGFAGNHFHQGMLAYLTRHGFTVLEGLPDGEFGVEPRDIKLVGAALQAERHEAIVHARRLTQAEVDRIRTDAEASVEDQLALSRWIIGETLKVPDITVDDVRFFDDGRGVTALTRFELAAGMAAGTELDGALIHQSQRSFSKAKTALYRRLLEALRLDIRTGEGSIDADSARAVVDLARQQPRLFAVACIVPATICKSVPKDAVKFANDALRLLGLKALPDGRPRIGVERVRRYGLCRVAHTQMMRRATVRQRHRDMANCRAVKTISVEDLLAGLERWQSAAPEQVRQFWEAAYEDALLLLRK